MTAPAGGPARSFPNTQIDRRRFLGMAGGAAAGLTFSPVLWQQASAAGAPAPQQLHLQFGADAAREMVVSWATPAAVANPRVRYGTVDGGLGSEVEAVTRTYRDHATNREIFTHHVPLSRLQPGSRYRYEVLHDGTDPAGGSFLTGPSGRAPFRFTSFGDQGVTGTATGSPYSETVVGHIEDQSPLLHLLNGDLAYSNLDQNPGAAWDTWLTQNQRSARNRPWMPAAGNHENETGNGETGFLAFTTRFLVPDNGLGELAGHFYAFTVGSVRFVVLQNDDVCYQKGGNFGIRGYSAGDQARWLDRTLAAARSDPGIDWIVVCMHQLVMSSAIVLGNGGDLGVREAFAPLFDKYNVDLVLCGHDHNYERTFAVRGVEPDSPTLRPRVTDHELHAIDATSGAVHMTLGGGGSGPANIYGSNDYEGLAKVIVGPGSQFFGDFELEPASWSAVTDPGQAFGFAAFDVDPGRLGGTTRLKVTYYRTALLPGQAPQPYDGFTLERPRGPR